jgi:hypothetical protein
VKHLTILVVGIILFMATLPAAASASGFGPCSQDRFDVKPRMGHVVVSQKVEALIRCAERRWSVSGGAAKAIDVADCESGLWPWSMSSTGKYLGLYQQDRYAWVERVHSFLRQRWFNEHQWDRLLTVPRGGLLARANTLMSMRMAHNSWDPWSCA